MAGRGIATVAVQVLTGDADAKLAMLGKAASDSAHKFEEAFGNAEMSLGEAFSHISGSARSSATAVEEAAKASEDAQNRLAEVTKKSAAEVVEANRAVEDSFKRRKAAEDEMARRPSWTQGKAVQGAQATEQAAITHRSKVATGGEWAIAGASQDLKRAQDAEKAALAEEKLRGALMKVGAVSFGTLVAGTIAVGVEAIKMGMQFENATAQIAGATGKSVASVKGIQSAFEGTAGTFMSSGEEMESAYAGVAGQLKLTEGHALNAKEALTFQTAATNLQAASGEKLQSVTNSTAAVMQVYNVGINHSAEVTDKLFNASRGVQAPIEQIAGIATKLHGRLGDLGGGLTSILALMTDASVKGLTGGRGVLIFNQALERLTSASKPTTQMLETLGVHLYNAKGQFLGMPAVISQLHNAFGPLDDAQRHYVTQVLFGKGATGEFTKIVEDGGHGLKTYTDLINKHKTAEEAAKKNQETLTGEFKTGKAAVETLAGALGTKLMPAVKAVGAVLVEGIQFMLKHKEMAMILAGVIIGPLVAAATLWGVVLLKNFVSIIPQVLGSLSELVASMGASTAAIDADIAMWGPAAVASAGIVDGALMATGIGATLVLLGGALLVLTGKWEPAMELLGVKAIDAKNFVISAVNEMAKAIEALAIGPLGLLAQKLGIIGEIIPKIGQEKESNSEAFAGHETVNVNEAAKWASGKGAQSTTKTQGGIMGYFMSHGFTAAQAAGIAGNWEQESSTHWNLNEKAPEGGTNIGIASWHDPGRQAALKKYAKSAGKSWESPEVQLAFALKEMNEKGISGDLKKAHSPQEAARIFNEKFEVGSETGKREKYAARIFKEHPQSVKQKEQEEGQAEGSGNAAIQREKEETEHGKPKASKAKKEAEAKAKKEENAYVSPFEATPHQERTDMGVDFTTKVGSGIKAIGTGVIDKIVQNWYKEQPLIEEKLTKGTHAGQYVYYAEGLTPGVKEGQSVKAGQRIATTTTQPTGLEFGFGAGGGRTLAEATTGYKEGESTIAGKQFAEFLKTLGKTGSALNVVVSAAETASKALEALGKKAETTYKKYENALQTGGVKILDKLTGATEANPTGQGTRGAAAEELIAAHKKALADWLTRTLSQEKEARALKHNADAAYLSKEVAAREKKVAREIAIIEKKSPITNQSVQDKELNALVASLQAAGLKELAAKLVTVHKEALKELHQELVATTQEKEAAKLGVENTHLKDLTTDAQNKGQKELTLFKDATTKNVDATEASSRAVTDAADVMKSEMAKAAQALADATQEMSDSFSGQSTATKDASNTKVAELQERGKYGLDLQAQREEVALDQMKQQYDAQIQAAKIALDQAKTLENSLVAQKQLNVTQTQQKEDALIAKAQASMDAERLHQDQLVLTAQTKVGQVQIATDDKVQADLEKQVVAALKNASKASQQIIDAQLKKDEKAGEHAVLEATAGLTGAETTQGRVMGEYERTYNETSAAANSAIATANQGLAEAERTSQRVIGENEQSYAKIQGEAGVAEAGAEAGVAETRARASTQYAGSGLVVNFTNIPSNDSAAIASELGFLMRTQLPVA